MPPLRIILVGPLRRYADGQECLTLEDWSGRSVRELLDQLAIPSMLVAVVLQNGRMLRKDAVLQDGGEIKLVPVLGGG